MAAILWNHSQDGVITPLLGVQLPIYKAIDRGPHNSIYTIFMGAHFARGGNGTEATGALESSWESC